jgi:hypothetical protein
MVRERVDGWRPWRIVPRLAAGAISVPVVVGFVALGTAVVIVRTLRDAARDTFGRIPSPWRPAARDRRESNSDSDAA